MATIKSQMALNDGMSAVLKKITSALDTTLASFEQIQRASGNAMDVAEIEAARGALADASNAVDEMAENYRRAAQEEERLNQGIHEGTSALDGMVTKVVSLVGAYMSLSAIKGFATSSMDAANTQINAQRQLRTVLNNMGAEENYQALADETSGNALENTLTLNTAGAVSNYEALVDIADGVGLENTLTLGTKKAMNSYTDLTSGMNEVELENTLALDTAGAMSSYKALVDMADGAELGNTLTLGTSEAVSNYTGLANGVDGVELENTLALDTSGAQTSYNAFATGVDGNVVTLAVQADATQATSAYDDILAKASEIQGRGIYGDEAMIAGAAEFATYFSDANAILSMMDTLTDYAMGMSGGGALDTEAMVDYATGLGKIMSGSYDAMTKKGFEFTDTQKAIIEGTATEAQIVAELGEEYLGMSQDMQAAAAINAVIAEGWGGLYEAMSNTPEGKLIQLNNTLGDIKENVGAGIYPAVVSFVDVIQSNTPQIEAAAMGLATMLGFVITLLTGMVEGALAFGSAVADNWSWIGPIVWGIVAALGAYGAVLLAVNGAQIVHNAIEAASNGIKAVSAAYSAMKAGATLAEAAATKVAEGAQIGLNAALLACPITWIVVGIIALIAIIYAATGAVNHFAGTSVSATGLICGAVAVAAAFIGNIVIALLNNMINSVWTIFVAPFLGIIEFVLNAANGGFNSFGDGVANLIGQIIGWFLNLGKVVTTIIDAICGANWTAELEGLQNAVTAWGKNDSAITLDKNAPIIDYRFEYGDAWGSGYDFGQGIEDMAGDLFSYEPGSMDDLMEKYGGSYPTGTDSFAMDGLGSDVSDIADNTGSMAKSMDLTGEELKYLRDIAERDAINRFTTAEVKVDFSGMTNKIDSNMDLDGVIRELTDGFSEALVTAAEGVHA